MSRTPAPDCLHCHPLRAAVAVRSPDDLRRAIARAKRACEEGVLDEVTARHQPASLCRDFDEVAAGGAWDDIVSYWFACRHCARRYQLSAETYHGGGGSWRPA